MITLNEEGLKKVYTNATKEDLNIFIPILNEKMVLAKYDISNIERVSCFIAQLGVESGEFRYVEEISSGRQYEGRLDLGNTQTGYGEKFKGHGLIQITGRSNHQACSKDLFGDEKVLLENPRKLCEPEWAVESALWYWSKRNLNSLADRDSSWRTIWKGYERNKFQMITIKINGGLTHYEERLSYYKKAKVCLLGGTNS